MVGLSYSCLFVRSCVCLLALELALELGGDRQTARILGGKKERSFIAIKILANPILRNS